MKKIKPGPGQESVWDYPRPPRLEKFRGHISIQHQGITLVSSNKTYRVLETSHPPVYYIPPEDIQMQYLQSNAQRNTFCEWKGMASYYDWVHEKKRQARVAWFYPTPSNSFEEIRDYLAFYPSKMEACYVNDELVQAQEGDFYGGWITSNIVGPFKGPSGTWGW
ncbi:MAG: DUF427 domain-containing protein [Bacteroidota bacterium]